jgi:hypothetical protein
MDRYKRRGAMDIKDFVNRCVDNDYEWAEGKHNEKEGYFIRAPQFDTKTHFSYEAIEQNDWPRLKKGIMQGKDVYHMTRIVGYYSRLQNWNKSKLGELADRHKGSYQPQ